jgi:hypothetical protein
MAYKLPPLREWPRATDRAKSHFPTNTFMDEYRNALAMILWVRPHADGPTATIGKKRTRVRERKMPPPQLVVARLGKGNRLRLF